MAAHRAPPAPVQSTKPSSAHGGDGTSAASVSSSNSMASPVDKAPVIHYGDEIEKLNSEYQLAWSEVMHQGTYGSSTDYEHVHVLMLSWDGQDDDLKVQTEIDELRDVFQNTFHYNVRHERLKNNQDKPTQQLVNKIVADWVWENDHKKALLIVYFAGHGKPGDKPGDLQITGKRSLTEIQNGLNQVTWNCAEGNLLNTLADVLQIFDCCYAGSLGHRGPSTAFEYLAACAEDQTTPPPGESSFTRALIWALKELHHDMHRFTTSHLCRKICRAEHFPKDQKPDLRQRMDANPAELIILQPLRSSGKGSHVPSAAMNGAAPPSPPLSPGLSAKVPRQYVLTLKYVFDTKPTAINVRELGTDLNSVVTNRQLHVNRIMWGGLVPRQNDALFRAVSRFKYNVRRGHSRPNDSITSKLFSSIKQANGSPKAHVTKPSLDDTKGYKPADGTSDIRDKVPQRQLQEYWLKKHALMNRTIWASAFLLLLSMLCCHRIYIFVATDDKWISWLRDAPFTG